MPEGRLGRARHCALVLPGGSCHGRAPRAHTLAAGSSLYSLSPALPGAAPQGGLLFSQNLLDGLVLQTQVREHLLEPPTFLFQVLEPGQLGNARPGVLTFPAVKRGLAQSVLAHNLGHGLPAQLSLQNRDNLRFAESSFFHGSVVE